MAYVITRALDGFGHSSVPAGLREGVKLEITGTMDLNEEVTVAVVGEGGAEYKAVVHAADKLFLRQSRATLFVKEEEGE